MNKTDVYRLRLLLVSQINLTGFWCLILYVGKFMMPICLILENNQTSGHIVRLILLLWCLQNTHVTSLNREIFPRSLV